MLVFNWAVGLSVLRTGALPKWMGWLAIVGGVASLAGPIGFVGAPIAAIWVIIASVMLSMRARSAPAHPAAERCHACSPPTMIRWPGGAA